MQRIGTLYLIFPLTPAIRPSTSHLPDSRLLGDAARRQDFLVGALHEGCLLIAHQPHLSGIRLKVNLSLCVHARGSNAPRMFIGLFKVRATVKVCSNLERAQFFRLAILYKTKEAYALSCMQ